VPQGREFDVNTESAPPSWKIPRRPWESKLCHLGKYPEGHGNLKNVLEMTCFGNACFV